MKKNNRVWAIIILFMLFSLSTFAQSASEKIIGPVLIENPVQAAEYPQEKVNVTFSAPPVDSSQRHLISFPLPASEWVTVGYNYYLNDGAQIDIPFTIEWAHFSPAESRTQDFAVEVWPNAVYMNRITAPSAITITATKPANLNQHKLAIIRDGYAQPGVFVQQISPVAGNKILSTLNHNFYFDHGAVIQIAAPNPTPSPCGASCPQVQFAGFTGDIKVVATSLGEVTMDGDKNVTIKYALGGGSSGTPTPTPPTPTPTASPVHIKGDVDANGVVNIVDALVVARFCAVISYLDFDFSAADTNCDGAVTIVDALLIARYTTGIIQAFCQ